jgi:hypothetical protein
MDTLSPWQISSALPSEAHELRGLGLKFGQDLVAPDLSSWPDSLRGAEVDFFEGNHGGGAIYPRSGMREHAAQSLCYIATSVASSSKYGANAKTLAGFEADVLAPLVADLSAIVAADKNRFSYGWVAEALRRLATCSLAAGKVFDDFLNSGRWKPPQMQLELYVVQPSYGSDPLMPTLLGPRP